MCELFAVSASRPFNAARYLSIFAQRGGRTARHKDGWGVAIREGTGFDLTRETGPACDSIAMATLERRATSVDLLLAHVRLAISGTVALKNTQPFLRGIRHDQVAFAHNGFLKDYEPLSIAKRRHNEPLGETDSEQACCDLIDYCQDTLTDGMVMENFTAFSRHARRFGPSNFIVALGGTLFAHADRRTQDNGRIEPPGLWLLELGKSRPASAEAGSQTQNHVVLIASVPLSGENWVPVEQGTVLQISRGYVTRHSMSD